MRIKFQRHSRHSRLAQFAAVCIALAAATSARAQWIVYDPGNTVQSIVNTAQEIVKFVEMIDNQIEQIEQLTEQVETLHHYVDLFGDPSKIAPAAVTALTTELRQTELGRTLDELESAAVSANAMVYTANGLFQAVNESFTTPNGATVRRRDEPYRPIAAVQNAAENFVAVSKSAAERRVAIKAEIARATDVLKAAKTDAEVQKITGVLVGLTAALSSVADEISQATSSAVIQDIANRADAQRQVEARKEQLHAEFSEAVNRYGQTFRLVTAPGPFPTR